MTFFVFDFDQTLVDTSSVKLLREQRNWKGVMARIPSLPSYEGITPLLSALGASGHQLGILTKSPRMVPEAFVARERWSMDVVIGYHDVKRRKPDPEGLLLAMSRVGATAKDTVHIGDDAIDTEVSRAAGVRAIGAAWDAPDLSALRASMPDVLFATVAELATYLLEQ